MQCAELPAEDGYELWLRTPRLRHPNLAAAIAHRIQCIAVRVDSNSPPTEGRSPWSPTVKAAVDQLQHGLGQLLGISPPLTTEFKAEGALVLQLPLNRGPLPPRGPLGTATEDESFQFAQRSGPQGSQTVLSAPRDIGLLYGAFALLRGLQAARSPADLDSLLRGSDRPRLPLRILNHWDNLDGTVERGYAGNSLWDWQKLPHYVAPRYEHYAQACASIGINGTVLTNVNSNALVLTEQYLEKVAALADVFRPYGVRVYLTARFSAPIELSGMPTADPREPSVQQWWKQRVATIYRYIPDFGGFAVKANSEGQPGPQNYGRSHAEGANLLAKALHPFGGIVMWRAFVYDHEVPDDRAKQAYTEFTALDGQFASNVIVQVKNGPIDFQPREPHHPLFGAMPNTSLMIEFQLAQEYLGCATNLAYLAPLFSECLNADTYALGEGSSVAKIVDGSIQRTVPPAGSPPPLHGMAAVTNIGSDRNWCGHPFGAANWYAFGRLAWDHRAQPEALAEQWVRQTFSQDDKTVEAICSMMMASRQAIVDFSTPLGLHHQMAVNHHYGPGPWVDEGRPDWTSTYYHRADCEGIGFDRTRAGSGAVDQYFSPVAERYGDLEQCPEDLLLWFHHVPWDHPMSSGRTLWNELCFRYQRGVDAVRTMQRTWHSLSAEIDSARFAHVSGLLKVQEMEARWWRDACVLYFQTFSQRPLPEGYEPAEKTLQQYREIRHYYVPGIPNPFVPKTANS